MTLRVLVLTPRGPGGVGGIDRLMNTLRAEILRLDPDVVVSFATTRGPSIWESPFRMLGIALRLFGLRLAGRLELVHVNLSSNLSAYRKAALAALCGALNIPYVIHLHGSTFASFWPTDGSFRRWMIDRLFLRSAGVIVLGDVWRRLVEERLPQLTSPIIVVNNAAPAPVESLTASRDSDDAVVSLLFLGELGERKGLPVLVQALAALPADAGWSAVLAGDGAVSATRLAVAEHGLAGRVSVPGWVGPQETTRLLTTSDVLVLPSFFENQPLSVIEAMAAGLAVVTTPVGATGDIIEDGVTGILIEPGDAVGLAFALKQLIDDPALRRRLGDAARAFHRMHLDAPLFANHLSAVWREASERGGGRRAARPRGPPSSPVERDRF